MGRHTAPEPPAGSGSVVRMPARYARARNGVRATVEVDLASSTAAVDDLTLITADDLLLDRIAAGQGDIFATQHHFPPGFPAGSLAPLLATWRSEIVDPQWPSVPTAEQAQEAVRADRRTVVKPTRRVLRPILGVAIAISALLFGSAAVGAQSAKPGDALWGLTKVLYAERADSYTAGAAANRSLNRAGRELSSGNTTSARMALTSALREMDKVKLKEVRDPLEAAYQTLMLQATDDSTGSAQSSAHKSAVGSQPAPGAVGSRGGGTTSVTPTHPRGSTGNAPGAAASGTTASRSTLLGPPVIQNSSRPPTTGRATAPPTNPTDPATTPTNSAVPGTSITSTPSISTAPGSPGVGTTAPGATTPGTPSATSAPATTEPSTTSVLPTATPTTPRPGGNVGTAPATTVASP